MPLYFHIEFVSLPNGCCRLMEFVTVCIMFIFTIIHDRPLMNHCNSYRFKITHDIKVQ